jgi:hypothetical protein
MQFGLKLDLQAVEQEIERRSALSGGHSIDVAVARFAMAFTKQGPREVAEYIDKHRQQLTKNLNPGFVASVEIQMLSQSGQIQLAEERILELSDPQQTAHERGRLARMIAEAKGTDPIEHVKRSSRLVTL